MIYRIVGDWSTIEICMWKKKDKSGSDGTIGIEWINLSRKGPAEWIQWKGTPGA